MKEEITTLDNNETWEKCEIPKGQKTMGCRWVYSIKYRVNGTIERYKAQFVAQGYTQTNRVDYSETFASVAKIDTIRVLFSIVGFILDSYKQRLTSATIQCEEYVLTWNDRGRSIHENTS